VRKLTNVPKSRYYSLANFLGHPYRTGTDMTMVDVEYLLSKLECLLEETTQQRSEIQALVDIIQGSKPSEIFFTLLLKKVKFFSYIRKI
jgi:hypothetical protein